MKVSTNENRFLCPPRDVPAFVIFFAALATNTALIQRMSEIAKTPGRGTVLALTEWSMNTEH
jgi:hypothetical protein